MIITVSVTYKSPTSERILNCARSTTESEIASRLATTESAALLDMLCECKNAVYIEDKGG